MKNKPEPIEPSLQDDARMRREMLRHLVDFIHRCSEVDINFEELSNVALSVYSIEESGTGE